MNRLFKPIFFISFFSILTLASCSYEKTLLDVSSFFEPTWDFSNTTEIAFNENFVELKNGALSLKPIDLEHSGNDFSLGSFSGSLLSEQTIHLTTAFDRRFEVPVILGHKQNDLISYYRFDGNNDDQLGSHNGISMAGQVSDGTPFLGDSSAQFDGVNEAISINSSSDFDVQEGTVSFWMRTAFDWNTDNTDPNNRCTLVSRNDAFGSFNGIFFHLSPLGVLTAGAKGASSNAGIVVGNIDPLNKWYHIAYTFSTVAGETMRLYVNGVEVSNSSVLVNWSFNSNDIIVGGSTDLFWEEYKGEIDELSFWSSHLTESEILSLYEQQSQLKSENTGLNESWSPNWDQLIGYWSFDGHWEDSSGQLRHGTANGNVNAHPDSVVGSSSAQFDGVSDFINIGTSPFSLESAQSMTILGWVKVDNSTYDGSVAYLVDSSGGLVTTNDGFWVILEDRGGLEPEESIQFAVKTTSGSVERIHAGDNAIRSNIWHHFAVTFKEGVGKIYIDGVDKTVQRLDTTGDMLPSALSINIGAVNSGSSGLNGFLDDISFFSEALSYADVNRVYHRQKQKYAAHYDSEVINLGSVSSTWPVLSWITDLPFGKELVGDFNSNGTSDEESSADYTGLEGSLNQGLVGYWPLNNNSYTGLTNEVVDISGRGHHGVSTGSPSVAQGQFNLGANFTDVTTGTQKIEIANSASIENIQESSFSMSSWYYPWQAPQGVSPNFNASQSILTKDGYIAGLWYTSAQSFACAIWLQGSSAPTARVVYSSTLLPGQFYHVSCSVDYEQNVIKLFINGKLVDTRTLEDLPVYEHGALPWRIGSAKDGTINYSWPANGIIDEVAIWDRVLTEAEMLQLYRRGANRLKFQVKSCIDANCECESFNLVPAGNSSDCDGDSIVNALDFNDTHKALFTGPGGDGTTYYSEIFNRKNIDIAFNCANNSTDGDGNICVKEEISFVKSVKPYRPEVSFNDFPLSARPRPNPYFQYRAYFEADKNLSCNESPCLPSLNSVSLSSEGQDIYSGQIQEIRALEPIKYKEIKSITLNADSCVTYQLSGDGTNYSYYSSGGWLPATTQDHRVSSQDLENHIIEFSEQNHSKMIYLKAFLETNSRQTSPCEIRSVDVNYTSN